MGMESAAIIPAAVAGVAAVAVAIEGIRAVTVAVAGRALPRPRIMIRLLGPLLVVASMARSAGPAAATTPPPILRLPVPQPGAQPDPQGPAATPVRFASPAPRYTVQPGDSLWAIACRQLRASGAGASSVDIDRYWRHIYEANRAVIGDDPDLIFPGQILDLPEA